MKQKRDPDKRASFNKHMFVSTNIHLEDFRFHFFLFSPFFHLRATHHVKEMDFTCHMKTPSLWYHILWKNEDWRLHKNDLRSQSFSLSMVWPGIHHSPIDSVTCKVKAFFFFLFFFKSHKMLSYPISTLLIGAIIYSRMHIFFSIGIWYFLYSVRANSIGGHIECWMPTAYTPLALTMITIFIINRKSYKKIKNTTQAIT